MNSKNLNDIRVYFSNNYSNASEVHPASYNINYRYFGKINLFKDNNGIANYQEIDVTSWLWPNYIQDVQIWDPIQPTFLLENSYSIKVAENNPKNISYIAFEHWRKSRFMFRACNNIPSDNVTCITPEWISSNLESENFIIETSKITSVGSYKLIFQYKLFGLKLMDDHNYATNITSYLTTFEILNENWFLITSQKDSWYILLNQMKNSTFIFADNENDTITLKLIATETR